MIRVPELEVRQSVAVTVSSRPLDKLLLTQESVMFWIGERRRDGNLLFFKKFVREVTKGIHLAAKRFGEDSQDE